MPSLYLTALPMCVHIQPCSDLCKMGNFDANTLESHDSFLVLVFVVIMIAGGMLMEAAAECQYSNSCLPGCTLGAHQPPILILENSDQATRHDIFWYAVSLLERAGYSCVMVVLDSKSLRVPSTGSSAGMRSERLIIIAILGGCQDMTQLVLDVLESHQCQPATIRQAPPPPPTGPLPPSPSYHTC
jgi:hypothetical protein